MFLFLFFFFSVSHFSIFLNVKDGTTPLYIAAANGHEQIVQLLLEKGKPNVDLPNEVLFLILLLILFFFFFFQFLIFSFSFFDIFLNVKNGRTPLFVAAQYGHEQIVQILLEKGKPNVDFTNKVLCCLFSFSFSFFSVSHFSIF